MNQQTKTALKQDQFLTTASDRLTWANENRSSLIMTAGLVLGAILLVVLAAVVYHNRSEAAATAFGAAMQAYQTPIAVAGQAVPPGVQTYTSTTERARAANGLFRQVADRYGFLPDGKNARYFVGLTYTEAGQSGPAEATLKQVASGWNKDLGALAKLALAQIYRQSGRDNDAIALYNQLTERPATTVPAGLAQLQLAELYQGENKPEMARKIYAQLKDKDPKGAAGVMAAQKLNPAASAGPQQ